MRGAAESLEEEDESGVLVASGVAVARSRNAGSYLCNYAYWRGLEAAGRTDGPAVVVFVHLPPVSIKAVPKKPFKKWAGKPANPGQRTRRTVRMDDLVRRYLSANRDARTVTTDTHALYFGTELNDRSLTPGENPRIGPTRFGDWLARTTESTTGEERRVGQR